MPPNKLEPIAKAPGVVTGPNLSQGQWALQHNLRFLKQLLGFWAVGSCSGLVWFRWSCRFPTGQNQWSLNRLVVSWPVGFGLQPGLHLNRPTGWQHTCATLSQGIVEPPDHVFSAGSEALVLFA